METVLFHWRKMNLHCSCLWICVEQKIVKLTERRSFKGKECRVSVQRSSSILSRLKYIHNLLQRNVVWSYLCIGLLWYRFFFFLLTSYHLKIFPINDASVLLAVQSGTAYWHWQWQKSHSWFNPFTNRLSNTHMAQFSLSICCLLWMFESESTEKQHISPN